MTQSYQAIIKAVKTYKSSDSKPTLNMRRDCDGDYCLEIKTETKPIQIMKTNIPNAAIAETFLAILHDHLR